MSKKKTKQNRHSHIFTGIAVLVVIIIILAAFVYVFQGSSEKSVSTVSIGGQTIEITEEQFAQAYDATQTQGLNLSKEEVLTALENEAVLLAKAQSLNITFPDEDVEQQVDLQIQQLKQQIGEDVFATQLATLNLTEEEFVANSVEELQNSLIINQLFYQEVYSTIQITEQDVQTYYAQNPNQFVSPQTATVGHILVCFEGRQNCASDRTQEQALSAITQILELAQTTPFDQLASTYSEDTASAQNGGMIGTIRPGQTVSAFEQVAFALEPGQISRPILTEFGYHLIATYEKTQPRAVSYEEIRADLATALRQNQFAAVQPGYIESLLDEAEISRRESAI